MHRSLAFLQLVVASFKEDLAFLLDLQKGGYCTRPIAIHHGWIGPSTCVCVRASRSWLEMMARAGSCRVCARVLAAARGGGDDGPPGRIGLSDGAGCGSSSPLSIDRQMLCVPNHGGRSCQASCGREGARAALPCFAYRHACKWGSA
jgi:hypothetical protein